MVFRYEHRGGVWVDLEQPTPDEIRELAKEFSIGEQIENELLSPTPTPLVAGDAQAMLFVVHFPAHQKDEGELRPQEVDFVVGPHFVLTVRYEVITPLHHLRKLLETEDLVEGRTKMTTDVLLELLFAHLYAAIRDATDHAAARLTHIEHDMFDGRERRTVRLISNVSREFLHLESAVANHEEPLGRFLTMLGGRGFFGPSFSERASRILAERSQVARLIATHRAVASELRETNSALLESRQNEIVKTLAVINFIFLPLELIAFIFAMHELGTPLENDPNAFWVIMGFMAFIALLLTFIATKRRWLFS